MDCIFLKIKLNSCPFFLLLSFVCISYQQLVCLSSLSFYKLMQMKLIDKITNEQKERASDENVLHHEKIQPPSSAGQIKRTSGTQHCSRFSTWRSEAVNSTEMHFIDEVSNPFRNLNAGPLIERLEHVRPAQEDSRRAIVCI